MKQHNSISFDLPDINTQKLEILRNGINEAIEQLNKNMCAGFYPKSKQVNYEELSIKYFLKESEGWVSPPAELVGAWFDQFKSSFPEYNSDEKLANLLGINSKGAARRIREYRNGEKDIPYGVWRHFLVITGRASQEIYPVLGIFDMEIEQAVINEQGTPRD